MDRQPERHVTDRLDTTSDGIARAASHLRAGRLVAFPTETVYGLGADATNKDAVAAIYAAKGRPAFNPLIVHVDSLAMAETLADLNDTARDLASRFWPGALTLVLPLKPGAGLADAVTAGLPTVAVRMPAREVARDIIRAAGCPVAAPSANPSGRISPTSADHVLAGLDGRIAAVVDGGSAEQGLESTIVAVDGTATRLLREGVIPADRLCLSDAAQLSVDTAPSAPGQLASHYAPRGTLRLNAETAHAGEVHIGFGEVTGDVTLSSAGDLEEAAQALYAMLHEMDRRGVTRIAVAPIPETGLGRAINDRLRRAAAPRD